MSQSAGGLFLQVKLDTSRAEQQLKNLGREFSRQVDPAAMSRQASAAVAAQAREAVAQQKAAAAAAKAAGVDATAQANVRIAELKAEAAAQKAAVDAQKTVARQQVAATTATNAQTRAQAALAVEAQRTNRVMLSDQLRRQRLADTAALAAQKDALRAARQEAEKLAAIKSPFSQAGGLLGAGAQDLFVGLGAARSGNVGYGLAAITRYFGSMQGAASGASVAVIGATSAIAAVGVAALTAGAAVGYLATTFASAGVEGASNFQLLRIQLIGLLGDAKTGQDEFDWLLKLGQTSIVPTSALVQADRQLLAFGVTATNVRRSVVSFISDLGSAMSASEEQVYFLSLAISQIVAKGKADAIDLRQLANVGVSEAKLLQIIGEQTGRSTAEVRAGVSEGAVTANQVLAGLVAYQKDLKGAAEAASASVSGLKQNLGDTFNTILSNTFLNAGVLQPLQDFLGGLMKTLQADKGLFDNFAASISNLFSAVLGDDSVKAAGTFVDDLFRNVLPNAVNTFAAVVRAVKPVVMDVFETVRTVVAQVADAVRASGLTIQDFGAIIGLVVGSLLFTIKVTASFGIVAVEAFTLAIYGAKAFYQALTLNFVGAFATIRQGLVSLAATSLRLSNMWSNLGNTATKVANSQKSPTIATPKPTKGTAVGSDPTGAANDAANQANAAKQAAQKVAQARDSLFQLLESAFGQPSNALKGLFGDGKTFTATADQIAGAAKQIRDSLTTIVPANSPLLDFLDKQTRKLIALAAQRDKIAEKLSAAQDKLKSLVSERDNFVKQLQDQAQGFVFSLNVGTSDTFTQLDNAGSFARVTAPGSFADSVKKKLADYKRFVANIRALEKAGLDKAVIKQLLQAGPDAAGSIAAQIAAGGSSLIADLNDAQKELSKLANDFGIEQGGVFYQSGIDQAQSIVDGLTSRQSAVTAAARKVTDAILKAVKPFAKKMRDAGADAGAGLAGGLSGALSNISLPDLSTAFPDLGSQLFGNDGEVQQKASDFIDAMLKGLDPTGTARTLLRMAQKWADNLVAGFTGRAITVISWVRDLPSNIVAGLQIGFASAKRKLSEVWGSLFEGFPGSSVLDTLLRTLFGPVLPYLKGLKLTFGRVGLWGILTRGLPSPGGILRSLASGFSGVPAYLKKLPSLLRSAIGSNNLWSFLLAGIPTFSTVYKALQGLPRAFAAVFNIVLRAWNALDFGIHIKLPTTPLLGPFSGFSLDINDIFPDVKPISLATGGIAKAPTLAVVGDAPRSSGELVAPLPPGFNIADLGRGESYTEVRVFLGDQELRGLVRTEVSSIDTKTRTRVNSGRRT